MKATRRLDLSRGLAVLRWTGKGENVTSAILRKSASVVNRGIDRGVRAKRWTSFFTAALLTLALACLLCPGQAGATVDITGTVTTSTDAGIGGSANESVEFLGGTLEATGSFITNRDALMGVGTIQTDPGVTLIWNGIISGYGGLQKTGSGTLILNTQNTYAQTLSLQGGELMLGVQNALAQGNVDLGSTTVLDMSAANANQTLTDLIGYGSVHLGASTLSIYNGDCIFHGAISGSGGLSLTGSTVMELAGVQAYTGATTLTNGTLYLAAANAIAASSGVAIASSGALDISNYSGSQTIQGLSGSGAVYLGARNLTVTGGGTYAGSIQDGGFASGTGGSLTVGGGTLTLSGSNTYTGATTVNSGGTLQAGAAGAFSPNSAVTVNVGGALNLNSYNQTVAGLTGGGNVTLGSASLTVNNATDYTYSGAMSGSGGLIKTGSGTLTLNGAQTYTGATLISAGTLTLGSANALASSSGVTVSGGTLNFGGFDQTFQNLSVTGGAINMGANNLTVNGGGTYAVVITGAGSLTKTGSGTLYLTGNNTYSGGTVLNSGAVSIGSAGNIGSGPITFNGCTLQFSADMTLQNAISLNSSDGTFDTGGHAVTLGGVVSGAGFLVKAGDGTLSLRGTNTYTGGTVINGGVVNILADNNLGDSSGNVTFNYGALQAGAPLSTARTFVVNGFGVLDNGGYAVTLGGTFTGTGQFGFVGSGNTTLSGQSPNFTGQAELAAGTLTLAASSSLGGTLTADQGTTVAGYGTLGNFVNNGLVSPGGAQGATLTVAGNYTQGPTGVYYFNVDPSLLAVGGAAVLNGGTLFTHAPIAFYPTGQTWQTITAAGGLTGTFAAVGQDFPSNIVRFLPVYAAGGVQTEVFRAPYSMYAVNGPSAAAGYGLNLAAFDAALPSDLASAILTLDLAAPATVASALAQLHPEPYDAFTQTGFDSGRILTSAVQGRLSSLRTGEAGAAFISPFDASPSNVTAFNELTQGPPAASKYVDAGSSVTSGVYVQSFGLTGRQSAAADRTAYGVNAGGMVGGMDFTLRNDLVAGFFGGYARRALTLGAPALGNGSADTYSLGTAASWFGKNWFVEGSVRLGLDDYQARRTVWTPAGSVKAGSNWNGWDMFANVGGGYEWHMNGWTFGPIASVDYGRIHQNGYGESVASSLGLNVHARSDASLQSALGGKVAKEFACAWGALTPEIRVQWGHEYLSGARDIEANYLGDPSAPFTTKTAPTASDWATVSAGLRVKFSEKFSMTGRVSTDLFRQGNQSLAGSLGVRYEF
jgi:outer membrane autotransporter protein